MTKIDTIIDALRLGLGRCPAREMGHFEQALAAARELKALTPVAYMQDSIEFYASEQQTPTFNKPLYVLEALK
jgi:hypothetical protein